MDQTNTRPDAVKLLDRKKRKKLDIGLDNYFFGYEPKSTATEAKMDKCDCIKLKNFCTAKEASNRIKRQPVEWEKIFANQTSDKGLISKIYKKLKQLNSN